MSFQKGNIVSLIYKRLKRGDFEVRPFQANKLWKFASDDTETFAGRSTFYKNLGIDVYRVLYPENNLYYGAVANLSSSLYRRVFTTQSLDPKLLWYSIDHKYYNKFKNDKNPAILLSPKTELNLSISGSLIKIPQDVFGEGIKPKSFRLSHYSTNPSHSYTMKDDGEGNVIDESYDTNKFIGNDRCLIYLGFNEKYREYGFRNKQTDTVYDFSNRENEVVYVKPKQIRFEPGIPTTSPVSSSGTCIVMEGGYLHAKSRENFNPLPKSSFAISFWINVPPSQSNYDYTYNHILNKNTMVLDDGFNTQVGKYNTTLVQRKSSHYPFDIKITNSSSPTPHRIVFEQSSAENIVTVSSSAITPGQWYHVVCQKSGSVYSIHLNGTLDSSKTFDMNKNVSNNHEMYIGGNGTTSGMISASIDEFRIYNQSLTSNQVSYLADNSYGLGYAYQTNVIGNIFYKTGEILVSDPRPKYANSLLGENGNFDYSGRTNGFSGEFRSTTTFYEYQVICKIRKNEFNLSQNVSLRESGDPNTYSLRSFVTSSYFNPYITTVGLYNDNNELLAIGKLASPLEKRDDVDMNIIVRWDI
jgi:hypothetical protein